MSGTALKIVALVAMTVDHVGLILFPQYSVFRIVGRVAFPIFAFMISQGCEYTKNKKKYLLTMLILGLCCQAVYLIFEKSLYMCILITFSLSVSLIYTFENAAKKGKLKDKIFAVSFFVSVCVVCCVLPHFLTEYNFGVDYGLIGVCIPLTLFFAKGKKTKLVVLSADLVLLSACYGGVQWWSLLSVPLIALYNGKRGKYSFKYLFYVYYPLHLAVIYLLSFLPIFS